ncbi:MAG TPA: 5-oxoprolinase subunit PxpB [Chitinophagaceae bacterium]|nr:5-oxoprolinase subunit PxpB [Chitinophagaceae bacterium]
MYFENVNGTEKYQISPLGDHALTIILSDIIDESINQKIIALFYHLQKQTLHFIKDIIPAYSSITIIYNVIAVRKKHSSAYLFIKSEIENVITNCDWNINPSTKKIEIPVCYDVSLGIDLEEMSHQKNIPVDEIIQLHCNKIYKVYMIGFLPGFAYMGSVDEKIITPRKKQPRIKVHAGSVGIAGEQTGIYPFDSPGGWNIVGQTPFKLFDATRETPVFLQAGDEIKFVPINLNEFKKLKEFL